MGIRDYLIAYIFYSTYALSAYLIYKYIFYPLLKKTYFVGPINSLDSSKKDLLYFGSTMLGWGVFLGLQLCFLWIIGILFPNSGNDWFIVGLVLSSYVVCFVFIVAVGWPKQFGWFIIRKYWDAQ